MQVDHHDLHHEFPEHGDAIRMLKTRHQHFSRLFDEYHVVTKEVERLEENNLPVGDFTVEDMKKKRIKLKDELYQMIVAFQAGRSSAS